ncbi:MAG: 5-(carboxyamino)imidazole ribonucleotide mutase [SAR202 cluster bacterium]|nr:5-(carboxyamino)imidazole ribonucleotide mutase [SAR202 cluster bacterium]
MPLVGILMGSRSDEPYVQEAQKALDELHITFETTVCSAHRNPEGVRAYAQGARGRGVEVLIAAAGGAAALPGVLASWTTLPVIGVPLPTSEMKGVDALHAIVQMPPGIPVACMAIGNWGARNAAFFAASILSVAHPWVRERLDEVRDGMSKR